MKYLVAFTLVLKQDKKIKMKYIFNFGKSGCFQYGNGMSMDLYRIEDKKASLQATYDIRYDMEYSKNDEFGYISRYVKSCWSNGEVKDLCIKELGEDYVIDEG